MRSQQTPASQPLPKADDPKERLAAYLRSHKMRCTPERLALLDVVMSTSGHFSSESFHEMLDERGFHVSRATVYNTLRMFADAGLVRRNTFDNHGATYEKVGFKVSRKPGGLRPQRSATEAYAPYDQRPRHGVEDVHYHLICSRCGKVKEVRDPEIAGMLASKRFAGFTTDYYSLNVYGLCSRCSRGGRKAAKAAHNT